MVRKSCLKTTNALLFKKLKYHSIAGSQRGFTLIEVLFTTAILSFCLSGLLAAYANIYLFSDLSNHVNLASNAVWAKIEEIKNCRFEDLVSTYDATSFDLDGFNASDSEAIIEPFLIN